MRTIHVDLGRQWRGGQRQCALLCSRLAAAGHETHLVCRAGAPLAVAAAEAGVGVVPLRPAGLAAWLAPARIARLVGRTDATLIAAHEARALGAVVAARRLARSSAAVVYHRRVDVPWGHDRLTRAKLAEVDAFICVSQAVAAIVAAQGIAAERIAVVHSGVPGLARVAAARAAWLRRLGHREPLCLLAAVGGLLAHKGHRVLLDAIAHLNREGMRVHAALAGSGPLASSLMGQIRACSLEHQVTLLGELDEVASLLSAADCYVHPSLTEGLGTSILDAMSIGTAVVAARAGGIPEIVVPGETGRLVAPGDAAGLARAIRAVASEPEATRRMAAAARERFRAEFTDRAMASGTLAVYERVCSGRA